MGYKDSYLLSVVIEHNFIYIYIYIDIFRRNIATFFLHKQLSIYPLPFCIFLLQRFCYKYFCLRKTLLGLKRQALNYFFLHL